LELIAIRAGYRTDTLKGLSALSGTTLGLGLNVWGQELAYAWVPYGDLGNTHYISLLMKFGEAERDRKNIVRYQNIKSDKMAAGPNSENHYLYEEDLEALPLMQLLGNDRNPVAEEPQK